MSKSLFLEERIAHTRRLLNERFVFVKAHLPDEVRDEFNDLVLQAMDILDGNKAAVPGEWVKTCGGKSSCCTDASASSSK